MKSQNRIFILLITIALLFFNPLTYFWVYGDTDVYSNRFIRLTIWTIFIFGIFCNILINRNRLSNKFRNIILSLAFTGILFSLVVAIDRFIGFTKPFSVDENQGLIFKPNSTVSYHTVEFKTIANINSLGLRGSEININKGDHFRILCFGDSWTFGWGVSIEESWPKKLETFLKETGLKNVEVINCGQPGQSTSGYKINMEKAIPLLKPDMVLVGILQIEDLEGIGEKIINEKNMLFVPNSNNVHLFSKIVNSTRLFLKASFQNIQNLFYKFNNKIIEVNSTWKLQSEALINRFSVRQWFSFSALTDTVRSMFISGNLNPVLLTDCINCPLLDFIFNDPKNLVTISAIKEMSKDLVDMKQICSENNTKLIFINLPVAELTGHQVELTVNDKLLYTYLYNNNKIDSIYRAIATQNNILYMEMTDRFKNLANKSAYFFRYDGHPTSKGQEEIANAVGEYIVENIKSEK